MDNPEDELGEWGEDVCEVCGAHVGYGAEVFHLSRYDECAEIGADGG